MDELVKKYRDGIPKEELTEAFKVYYDTKDSKIREQLIYRYMPIVKKVVLNYNITTIEKEDLVQMAYEILIRCIDRYNQYEQCQFSTYLYSTIRIINKRYNKKIQNESISLSNIEIYSNDDLESNVINKIDNQQLLSAIKKILNEYPNKKSLKIFKMIFGIDCEILQPAQIVEKENISKQRISEIKYTILMNIFISLNSRYRYYPSELLEKIITDTSANWVIRLPDQVLNQFSELIFNELDYLTIYESCDGIEDSHELIKKK